MRSRWILLLPAALLLGGCASIQDHYYRSVNGCRAYAAWYHHGDAPPGHGDRGDFKCGWIAGYYDTLTGGDGTPPPVPPQRYMSPHYQSPRGLESIQAWYRGFCAGAHAGQGSRYWNGFELAPPVEGMLPTRIETGATDVPIALPPVQPLAVPAAAPDLDMPPTLDATPPGIPAPRGTEPPRVAPPAILQPPIPNAPAEPPAPDAPSAWIEQTDPQARATPFPAVPPVGRAYRGEQSGATTVRIQPVADDAGALTPCGYQESHGVQGAGPVVPLGASLPRLDCQRLPTTAASMRP